MPASAVIDLVARTRGFTRKLKGVQSVLQKLGHTLHQVGMSASVMFAGTSAILAGVIISFASFEKRLARVSGLASATAAEMVLLENAAREMGKVTVFSANQAADAMAEFALQGFKTQEIIAALEPTLNLAAAAQLGMGQAAKITAGVMKGMKIPVSELTRVVDVLTMAAISSATNVSQLGEAFRALGPIANTAGVSLEEATAVLRALADVMIVSSQGGTALRNILLRLSQNTGDTKKAMDALGVSIADVATGKMKPLATIIDEVNVAMKGYSDVQKLATGGMIAGMRAAGAFLELMALGGDIIREYTEEQENSAGTAKRLADIMRDTLSGSFTILISAVTETGIALGQLSSGPVRSLVDATKDLVEWFNNWNKTAKILAISLGLVTTALLGIVATAALAIPLVIGLTGAMVALNAAMLLNPAVATAVGFAAVIAGIIAASAALIVYVKSSADANTALKATKAALGDVIPGFDKLRAAQKKFEETKGTEDRVKALVELKKAYRELKEQILEQAKALAGGLPGDAAKRTLDLANKQVLALDRQIKKSEEAFKADRKAIADKARIQGQADRDREEAQARIRKRIKAANVKADKNIKTVTDALRVARGEIDEIGLVGEALFKSGAGVERVLDIVTKMRELKKLTKETKDIEDRKAEAKSLTASVRTDRERLAIEKERANLLLAEGRITAETHRRRMEQLNEQADKTQSMIGAIEGLRSTFARQQAAAARRVSGAGSSASKTADSTKKIAMNTKETRKSQDQTNAMLAFMSDQFAKFSETFTTVGRFA